MIGHRRRTLGLYAVVGGVAVMAAVSILSIQQYRFGDSTHAIIIPFLKDLLRPELYPGDYLLGERSYYYTFLWPAVALVVEHLGIPIPQLFFVAYCLCVLGTFFAVFAIARLLSRDSKVGFLALFLLLFGNPAALALSTSLGGASFVEAVAALPLLLSAVAAYLAGRFVLSFALQGIAFLIHPLTAVYLIGVLLVVAIIEREHLGRGTLVRCFTTLGLLASPILIWRVLHSPLSISANFIAQRAWLELLSVRSAHHVFPFDWSKQELLRFALVLVLLLTGWVVKPSRREDRVVRNAVLVLLCMWATGTVFAEFWPIPFIIQLQLFRSSSFLLYFVFVYWASFVVGVLESPVGWRTVVPTLMASWIVFYGTSWWWHAVVGLLVLGAGTSLYRWRAGRGMRDWQFAGSVVAVSIALGIIIGRGRPPLTMQPAQAPHWLDVQEWARAETQIVDAFIVPPTALGFRVLSERAVYGDWKDGTQMFFNPAFGFEWMRRMQTLGYHDSLGVRGLRNLERLEPPYHALSPDSLGGIASRVVNDGGRVYAVGFRGMQDWTLPVAYQNQVLVVYQVSGSGSAD